MTVSESTRRSFLAGSVALAGLRARRLEAAASQPDDLKLGVATYSLRKFSRAQSIQMMKQLRVSYVCIKEFHLPYNSTPAELASGRKEYEDAELKILGGGVIYLEKPGQVRKMFEYCRDSGMPMMVCGPTREALPELEGLVKEFNIKAAIHNHGPEDKHFPTPQSILEAIKGMDARVGVCVDVGHTARAGADILDSLRVADTRLFDVHIKDLRSTARRDDPVPVGEGVLPIVAIFKTLKEMNFHGGVMLEYEIDADDPMPGMAKSFAYMRGVLAGLRG